MKCPECGAQQSRVKSTRHWQGGAMLQRRRECFNGHLYTTYEIGEQLAKTLEKYAVPSARGIEKTSTLWKRDTGIVRAIRAGRLTMDVAAEHGISPTTVSAIIRRRAPELLRKKAKKNG